jgi:hypothetical protein
MVGKQCGDVINAMRGSPRFYYLPIVYIRKSEDRDVPPISGQLGVGSRISLASSWQLRTGS